MNTMSTASWSESAFGVVHKSFNRLQPKLLRALPDEKKMTGMDERIRHNYAMYRQVAGNAGKYGGKQSPESVALQREFKRTAKAQVTAAGNRSRRRGRYLP